ncbi:hypothetical protein V7x_50980 [Crateriforma conspicua]|uniref:Uncharacterized protein n=1 Tax=Crateriforma conspicua TaxID=2527996 RepID=A0A5C6FS15_9PLAN|nr:hypothetical protein V7x_50980 [Crateriforma conspicua]
MARAENIADIDADVDVGQIIVAGLCGIQNSGALDENCRRHAAATRFDGIRYDSNGTRRNAGRLFQTASSHHDGNVDAQERHQSQHA